MKTRIGQPRRIEANAPPAIHRIAPMHATQKRIRAKGEDAMVAKITVAVMRHAVLSAEDGDFFNHFGFSPTGLIRAVVTNPTGAWTTINAQFSGNARDPQPPMSFRLSTQDTGLADRIEYAMKFLQASCDITADTGF